MLLLMSTRILLAGIVGGVVMFIWGFVAHEVLPIGEMGVKMMPNEEPIMTMLQTNLGNKSGLYVFPSGGLTPDATAEQKKEAMEKAEEQMASGAAGFLVYRPKRVFNFPKRLAIEFATDVIGALLAVFLLAQTSIRGFGGKVGFVLVLGILAAFVTDFQYMNWFGFPKDYTLGHMISEIVSFLLIGIVAALMIKQPAASTP